MSARTCTRAALMLVLLAAMLLLVSGCGSDDDSDSGADDAKATTTTTEDGGGTDDEDLPPIQITSPKTFQSVYGSFELAGTAAVHEGTVAWQILDADLQPMLTGFTTASCGAPCRGDFSTKVDVTDVAAGSWEMHVYQPQVADDDPSRMHDVIVPITITTGPIEDQPDADAPPPGGVPDSPAG